MVLSMEPCFYGILTRQISKLHGSIDEAMFFINIPRQNSVKKQLHRQSHVFTVLYLRKFVKKTWIHRYYSIFCNIHLFLKINMYHLAISYDNTLFIPVDVPGDGNYLFRVLVESDIISISDSKTFRSSLSIRPRHVKSRCIRDNLLFLR